MWPFLRRTTIKPISLLQEATDWHCHILPGVDDGIRTMGEALELLRLYEKEGIREIWMTPHIMEDIPNTTEVLKQRFEELKKMYTGSVQLNLAAEYMLDNLFEERLVANDLLPIGKDRNCLLVETSFFNPPYNLQNLLERLKEKGYIPVLAHPERYMYMQESDYKMLRGKGVLFQLNLFSLSGAYGSEAKEKAEWLWNQKMVHWVGTDTHTFRQFAKYMQGNFSLSIK